MNLSIALLFGLGAGGVHAVTAPDHILSLVPVVLRAPARGVVVGTAWGVGHGVGTLLLGMPLLVLAAVADLPRLSAWGLRLAGVALLVTTAWSWWESRRSGPITESARAPFMVGLVHGITGAGALLLMLPVVVSGSLLTSTCFLLAFALGSTLGMIAFAWMVGRLGERLAPRAVQRLQAFTLVVGAVVGVGLIAAG